MPGRHAVYLVYHGIVHPREVDVEEEVHAVVEAHLLWIGTIG
jgi:hypothetical protein